jgi:hypothetical protein
MINKSSTSIALYNDASLVFLDGLTIKDRWFKPDVDTASSPRMKMIFHDLDHKVLEFASDEWISNNPMVRLDYISGENIISINTFENIADKKEREYKVVYVGNGVAYLSDSKYRMIKITTNELLKDFKTRRQLREEKINKVLYGGS